MGAAADDPLFDARAVAAVEAVRAEDGWLGRTFLYRGDELADLPTTPLAVRRRLVGDVERVAQLLLLYPRWLRRIGRLITEARPVRKGKPVRLLDVGAGHGGLLRRVEDWARARRIPVELRGVDPDPDAVEQARRMAFEEGRRTTFEVGDPRALDVGPGAADVVVSTFLLHHLAPGDAARVLAEVDRVAAVNVYVFDVRRSLPGLPGLWTLLRLADFEAPTRFDALASLRKGYTPAEIEALLATTGLAHLRVRRLPPAFWELERR